MATNQFDELTRAFASSTSRRQALKALVLGAGGLLGLGSLGTALAEEAPYCGRTGDSCAVYRCCKGYSCNLKTHICYKSS